MRKGSRAMKKLLFLGIGSALMFTMGGVGPAVADAGPHVSTAQAAGTATVGNSFTVNDATGAGRCAGCHRAHTAKASYLLKAAEPALCYSCHQAGAMGSGTDVSNGVDADTGAALRGGGFDYALIGTATKTLGALDPATGRIAHSGSIAKGAPTATTSKHQIDGAIGTMWGNGAISASIADTGKTGIALECTSCHDPHGNGNYRILKPIPTDANNIVTAAIKVGDIVNGVAATVAVPAVMSIAAPGINIPDSTNKVYITGNYWKVEDRSVPLVTGGGLSGSTVADGYITNIAAWCTTCHTRYLAGSGSYNTPNQGYPAVAGATGPTDANFTYRHRSDRSGGAGTENPNCIQCHVSHGSNVAMAGYAAAVPFPGQIGTNPDKTLAGPTSTVNGVTADPGYGDSKLLRVENRGTCVMCHNV